MGGGGNVDNSSGKMEQERRRRGRISIMVLFGQKGEEHKWQWHQWDRIQIEVKESEEGRHHIFFRKYSLLFFSTNASHIRKNLYEAPVSLSEEEVAVLFGLQTVYLWDDSVLPAATETPPHSIRREDECLPVYLNRIAHDPLGIRELYEGVGSDLAGSNCFMGVRRNPHEEPRSGLDQVTYEAPLLSVPNGCGGFANIRSDFFPLQTNDMYVSSDQYWCGGREFSPRRESRRDESITISGDDSKGVKDINTRNQHITQLESTDSVRFLKR